MDDRPSNCGDICYSWHKRNINNPKGMVDAYEAIENDPKYVACCAPDRPYHLMSDLSDARTIVKYGYL